jgi:transposase-like protein
MPPVIAGSSTTTYVKVAGRWTYLYRAVDQHG